MREALDKLSPTVISTLALFVSMYAQWLARRAYKSKNPRLELRLHFTGPRGLGRICRIVALNGRNEPLRVLPHQSSWFRWGYRQIGIRPDIVPALGQQHFDFSLHSLVGSSVSLIVVGDTEMRFGLSPGQQWALFWERRRSRKLL